MATLYWFSALSVYSEHFIENSFLNTSNVSVHVMMLHLYFSKEWLTVKHFTVQKNALGIAGNISKIAFLNETIMIRASQNFLLYNGTVT